MARAAAGLSPGRPIAGDRSRAGRRRSHPLSLSLSSFFSLLLFRGTTLCRWYVRPPSVGRTPTGRTPGASGGHRLPPRPDEMASMPPGLNQRGSRTGPEEGPPDPLVPLSRIRYPIGCHLRCRWGRRPKLRPGEATCTPPSPNQSRHRRQTPWPPPRPALSLSTAQLSLYVSLAQV